MRAHPCMCRRVQARSRAIPHIPHIPHTPYESCTYASRAPHTIPHTYRTKKMMMDKSNTKYTRTIRCTPDNAAEIRQLIKRWPQLNALVQSLQEQNMFPGLRALQITLEGSAAYVAKGLAAVQPQNATQRD